MALPVDLAIQEGDAELVEEAFHNMGLTKLQEEVDNILLLEASYREEVDNNHYTAVHNNPLGAVADSNLSEVGMSSKVEVDACNQAHRWYELDVDDLHLHRNVNHRCHDERAQIA